MESFFCWLFPSLGIEKKPMNLGKAVSIHRHRVLVSSIPPVHVCHMWLSQLSTGLGYRCLWQNQGFCRPQLKAYLSHKFEATCILLLRTSSSRRVVFTRYSLIFTSSIFHLFLTATTQPFFFIFGLLWRWKFKNFSNIPVWLTCACLLHSGLYCSLFCLLVSSTLLPFYQATHNNPHQYDGPGNRHNCTIRVACTTPFRPIEHGLPLHLPCNLISIELHRITILFCTKSLKRTHLSNNKCAIFSNYLVLVTLIFDVP